MGIGILEEENEIKKQIEKYLEELVTTGKSGITAEKVGNEYLCYSNLSNVGFNILEAKIYDYVVIQHGCRNSEDVVTLIERLFFEYIAQRRMEIYGK